MQERTRYFPRWTATCLSLLALLAAACADDWPTFRHDNRRSAISTEELSPPLSEEWVFTSTFPPEHAWGDPQPKPVEDKLELPRLRFDDAFHVVAVGDLVYFGSSSDTKVYALEARTASIRWEFCTDGPVRVAPTLWQGKLYVGSDDGKVYCLDGENGRLIWEYCAAPAPDMVLGNGKMISLWPVRTCALVEGGVVYFAAGVFPAEGLYLYAVDAEDGKLLWKNDTYGRGGMGTISPQGYMLLSESRLFVPAGRGMPAAFSREDGQLLFHKNIRWSTFGGAGGTHAVLADDLLFCGVEQIVAAYERHGGPAFAEEGRQLVVGTDTVYLLTGREMVCLDRKPWREMSAQKLEMVELNKKRQWLNRDIRLNQDMLKRLQAGNKPTDGPEAQQKVLERKLGRIEAQRQALAQQLNRARQWSTPCGHVDSIALSRHMVFAGGTNAVDGFDVVTGEKVWSAAVEGKARGLAVANGRLLVSTDTGRIHCFLSGGEGLSVQVAPQVEPPLGGERLTGAYAQMAEEIVNNTRLRRGYALVLGDGTGRFALELARRTEMVFSFAVRLAFVFKGIIFL